MGLGLSVDNMIDEYADVLNLDPDDGDIQTAAVRHFNAAQRWMFNKYEWPELIESDQTFTTDGSASYDLTAVGYFGSSFGRVRDKSIRIGNNNVYSNTKSYFDEVDPDGSSTGTSLYYCQVSRTDFRLWPVSSGDTVKLDYLAYPTVLTSTTTEASISFEATRHELICDGGIWRGMRKYGFTEWRDERKEWFKQVKDIFGNSRVHFYPKKIIPSW